MGETREVPLAHAVAVVHAAAVVLMLTGALVALRRPRVLLEDLSTPTLDGDVLVVGDVREATDLVQALAGRLPGMRGVYAGRLRNAAQVEALTVNLVSVNRRYKAHAGIRVTDV